MLPFHCLVAKARTNLTTSFATFAGNCPDSDLPLLRELLALDSLCTVSFPLRRANGNESDGFVQTQDHSPLHWSRQVEWPWVLREGDFEQHHCVLDIGGGWSVLRYAVADRCYSLTSIDNDEPSVKTAERCAAIVHRGRIAHAVMDARDLHFPDNHFDRTLCISVLEHIPDGHLKCVQEAVRVTKPGGMVLLSMDVVVQGTAGQDNNFYLNVDAALEILDYLKVPLTPTKGVMSEVLPGLHLGVLLVRYVKPE